MKDRDTLRHTEVFAHRGWSARYPENTMIAFLAAIELGVDGLEFDVHLTKDGEVVIIHDSDVSRTTNGEGLVEEMTYAQLRQLDAGSWVAPEFAEQVIPTFDELLAVISMQKRPVQLNVELKGGRALYTDLAEAVWQKVSEHGLLETTIVSSFNHFALRDMKRMHPDTTIAVLYGEGLVDPWRYAMFLDAKGIHPHFETFDEAVVRETQSAGKAIRPYTVNHQDDMWRMLAWGVDAVITDHPDVLLSLRETYESNSSL